MMQTLKDYLMIGVMVLVAIAGFVLTGAN